MKHTYHIHGMTCNGCRTHVEDTLGKVEGVSNAFVNLEKAEATIEMDSHIPIKKFQEVLKKDGGTYSIHEDGGQHHTTKKKGKLSPKGKEKEQGLSTALCIAKVTKPTIPLVIVPYAEWIWWKNKIYPLLQATNGPARCTPKL